MIILTVSIKKTAGESISNPFKTLNIQKHSRCRGANLRVWCSGLTFTLFIIFQIKHFNTWLRLKAASIVLNQLHFALLHSALIVVFNFPKLDLLFNYLFVNLPKSMMSFFCFSASPSSSFSTKRLSELWRHCISNICTHTNGFFSYYNSHCSHCRCANRGQSLCITWLFIFLIWML